MAQWQDLLGLDSTLQSRVSQLYEGRFPREIRHWLCTVIESQNWDSAAVDENRACSCFNALLGHLEEQRKSYLQENNILLGPDYSWMRDYLLRHFQDNPLNLATVLSECLKKEKKILDSASGVQACGIPTVEQKWKELDNKISDLKSQTQEVKKEKEALEYLYERLNFIQETRKVQVEQNVGLAPSLAVVEDKCLKKASIITHTKEVLLQQILKTLKLAEEIVVTLTDVELPQWKCRQQMACIGSPVDTCLDHLQNWFTAVVEVLLDVREQLEKLQDQSKKYSSSDSSGLSGRLVEIEKFATSLCTKILVNALVVEKQPIMSSLAQRPLILKTGVRFTVSVRFLANLPKFKYLLRVKPTFDKDIEEATRIKGFRRFDVIKDDFKVLDGDVSGGGLVAEFGHMSLKETKEKIKGSSETRLGVTEELHIIKFVTEFQHTGLKCNIEASTLPVIVISASSQVTSAWASVMWCNALSISQPRNLSLFVDPPPLPWTQLSQVLSWQFLSVGQRQLDENQLSYLKEKLAYDPDDLVHWTNFSKNESAWIWIDGILDLIKKHLVDLWRHGLIMGFVSRKQTQALLQEKQTGNFLLRFSESIKDGAITFSWVEHSNGETHVHAVEPYSKQELSTICLPDIIHLYSLRAQSNTTRNPLRYLYPDIPKDTAFGPYYKMSAMSAFKKDVDGYVIKTLVPLSAYPTPPPSPPRQSPVMDMDVDVDLDMDTNTNDPSSGLLDLPKHAATLDMSSPQNNCIHPTILSYECTRSFLSE